MCVFLLSLCKPPMKMAEDDVVRKKHQKKPHRTILETRGAKLDIRTDFCRVKLAGRRAIATFTIFILREEYAERKVEPTTKKISKCMKMNHPQTTIRPCAVRGINDRLTECGM